MLYDNGSLEHVNIDTNISGDPDINDLGEMVWTRATGGFVGGELVFFKDGEEHFVFFTNEEMNAQSAPGGRINNHGHVMIDARLGTEVCPGFEDNFYLMDDEAARPIAVDGFSNQSGEINDRDEMVWHRYDFCGFPDEGNMRHDLGVTEMLPNSLPFPDFPNDVDIANDGVIVWGYSDGGAGLIERWENGVTTWVGEGNSPNRNMNDWIVHHYYGIWLRQPGKEPRRITSVWEGQNGISNSHGKLNEFGEIAWRRWEHDPGYDDYGIRLMRRIRTGDVNADDHVDIADFARFPGCYTGSVETNGLCVCRFLDIDHDRDVDWHDFNQFMSNYTGPVTDCTGRNIWDLADGLVAGTIQDCNVNGIDDACEIQNSEEEEELSQRRGERGEKNESTTASDSLRPLRLREKSSDSEPVASSLDVNGNGVPDECDCPIFQPIHTNAMPSIKNRYISFTSRVSYWTPKTAFIDPRLEGKRAAIRVKFVNLDRFPELNGQVRWVGPPSTYPDATTPFGEFIASQLQCEPYYADWSHAEYMHAFGDAIVPNSRYEVQIVAESCTPPLLDETKFSPPVTIVTQKWGDVAEPNGGASQPNFSDITRLVDAFRQAEGAIVKPRAQLQPQTVNPAGNVTFSDISTGVARSAGLSIRSRLERVRRAFTTGPADGRLTRIFCTLRIHVRVRTRAALIPDVSRLQGIPKCPACR